MKRTVREFGSDFHFVTFKKERKEIGYPHLSACHFYADGRHALKDLLNYKIQKGDWKRIWMPEYFCYDVINSIRETGIEIAFYPDNPMNNDQDLIPKIKFFFGDVLFRINYFGLRNKRDNSNVPVETIEDHSHDLISDWALSSNADWCIASLRKSLPVPEGGILWSPKNDIEEIKIKSSTVQNDNLTYKKMLAMFLKKLYLEGHNINKNIFRRLMIEFEEELNNSFVSGISEITKDLFVRLPITDIYNLKKSNWELLTSILNKNKISVLEPEKPSLGTPFSVILKFKTENQRNWIKSQLIKSEVYPAILWQIPNSSTKEVYKLGNELLSIHCDLRYDNDDIIYLGNKIVEVINKFN